MLSLPDMQDDEPDFFSPFGTYRTHNALKNTAERKIIECISEGMPNFHILIAHLFCEPTITYGI
jgi:hypothetical protein